MADAGAVLWSPPADIRAHTRMGHFLDWLEQARGLTFAGYPGTTGLRTIDYRLTDPHLDPPNAAEACYAEESIRPLAAAAGA